MKFYVIRQTSDEQAVNCTTSKKEAMVQAASMGYRPNEFYLEVLIVPVNSDSICRLLGNLPGFAVGGDY